MVKAPGLTWYLLGVARLRLGDLDGARSAAARATQRALDGLLLEELPDASEAAYPLSTQMKSGKQVLVDESFIGPKLQKALNRLEAKGVVATLLLCAGTFANLRGTKPVYKPFDIGCSVLKALNMNSIGLITPVPGQEVPIRKRWETRGWKTTVWSADLGHQDQAFHRELNSRIKEFNLDCVVLDYVGHPPSQVMQGYLSMVILANTV